MITFFGGNRFQPTSIMAIIWGIERLFELLESGFAESMFVGFVNGKFTTQGIEEREYIKQYIYIYINDIIIWLYISTL